MQHRVNISPQSHAQHSTFIILPYTHFSPPASDMFTPAFIGSAAAALQRPLTSLSRLSSLKRSCSPLRLCTTRQAPVTARLLDVVDVPEAHVEIQENGDVPMLNGKQMDEFGDIMLQFSVALLGVYAAVGGVESALAVPEALVEAYKSTPVSLVHPAVMWTVFGTSLYTFYLGYQSSLIRKSEPETRKKLVKSKVTQRHFLTSASLFAVMTIATFSGMGNTYARTGKLFPGPHLYAGLGLVALLSVMSSLVPHMQQGKNWARNVHFTLAFGAIGLFGWQAKSGMVIVGKLLDW